MQRILALICALVTALALAVPASASGGVITPSAPEAVGGEQAAEALRSTTASLFAVDESLAKRFLQSASGGVDVHRPTASELALVQASLPPQSPYERRMVSQVNDRVYVTDIAAGSERRSFRLSIAPSFEKLDQLREVVSAVIVQRDATLSIAANLFDGSRLQRSLDSSAFSTDPIQCEVNNLCSIGNQAATGLILGTTCIALGALAAAPTLGLSVLIAGSCLGATVAVQTGIAVACLGVQDVSCSQRIDGNLFNMNRGGCPQFNECNFKGTTSSKANLLSVDGLYIYYINGYTSFEVRNISTGYRKFFESGRLLSGERIMTVDIGFPADTNSRRESCSRSITADVYANFSSGRSPRATYSVGKDGGPGTSESSCGRA